MQRLASAEAPAARLTSGVDRRAVVAVAVPVLVAVVSCMWWLSHNSLYLDETVSATLGGLHPHRFVQVVSQREPNMVLYSVFLQVWEHLGRSTWLLRFPSAVMAVATVGLLARLASVLLGPRVGLLCGLLFAVDPLLVEFAQDARSYAMSLLLVTGASVVFVGVVRGRGGRASWPLYVLLSTLAAYANLWAALVPLAHGASLAFSGRPPVRPRVVAAVAGALGLLLLPLALLVRATDSAGTDWAAGTAAGHIFTTLDRVVPRAAVDAAVLAGLVVLLFGIRHLRRKVPAASLDERWPFAFLACWALVPVALVVLLSATYKPLLVLRYLVIALPPVFVLLGALLARLPRRSLQLAGALLLVGSLLWCVPWYRHGPGQDWRDATAYVATRAAPGDAVVLDAPYMRVPFEWYLDLEHPAAGARLVALWPAGRFGADPIRFDYPVRLDPGALEEGARSTKGIWVILCEAGLDPQTENRVLGALSGAGFAPATAGDFPGVVVEHWVPVLPAASSAVSQSPPA